MGGLILVAVIGFLGSVVLCWLTRTIVTCLCEIVPPFARHVVKHVAADGRLAAMIARRCKGALGTAGVDYRCLGVVATTPVVAPHGRKHVSVQAGGEALPGPFEGRMDAASPLAFFGFVYKINIPMKATPIVKWAGGKTRLLPRLLAEVPSRFRRYYEPFMGGAALFFALEPEQAVLGDVNKALVATYRAVVEGPDALIRRLLEHRSRHAREAYFYEVRSWWNHDPAPRSVEEIGAAMIYMNKTGFNGLWRENKKGEFNVPRGNYDNPVIFDEETLRAASVALSRARILCARFDETTADAGDGDFVYFDPPYDPLSDTSSFTAYAANPFGKAEQRALAEHARLLRDRGAFVMLSNNDTPFVRELYDGFEISTAPCGRSINSKASGRGKIDEVIITSRRA